ncbi:unnamed protein product [Caenorhabditis nigoni]
MVAVTIIGTIQLLSYSFYAGFLTVFAHLAEKNPSPQDTNVIEWLYVDWTIQRFNLAVCCTAVHFLDSKKSKNGN